MFEDQNQNAPTPPGNLPTEPPDMFAGVEPTATSDPGAKLPDALSAGLLKKKTEISAAPAPSAMTASVMPKSPEIGGMAGGALSEPSKPIVGKIILFLVLAAGLGAAGYGGWWAYVTYVAKPAPLETPEVTPTPTAPVVDITPPAPEVVPAPAPEPAVTTTSVSEQITSDTILFGEPVDTDRDGLPDIREQELGLNPLIADTDGDELSDGDEILTWKTNPLSRDTDGDTYEDGAEIKNGYNPAGPGKLTIQPPVAATSSATTSTL